MEVTFERIQQLLSQTFTGMGQTMLQAAAEAVAATSGVTWENRAVFNQREAAAQREGFRKHRDFHRRRRELTELVLEDQNNRVVENGDLTNS